MLNEEIFNKLPEVMQTAIKGLRELHSSPDELAVPVVLQIANFAVQGLVNVNPELWGPMPLSLYTVVLNKSSGRKSTVLSELTAGIKRFEKEERLRYKQEIGIYNVEYANWEREFKQAIKDRKDDPSIVLPKAPTPIVGDNYMLDKATVNGLIDALHDVPHCAIINPDAAEFFKSYSFQDKGSGRDTEMITTLSKLFSGESVSRQTGVKENNVTIDQRRFCMLAMLQEEMADFLSNPDYRDQGFIPRLLISAVGDYEEEEFSLINIKQSKDSVRKKMIDPFNNRVYECFNNVIPVSTQEKQRAMPFTGISSLASMQQKLQEQQNNWIADIDPREIQVPVMQMNNDARRVFDKFGKKNQILSKQSPYSVFSTFMNRRYEYVVRIAATLAIFHGNNEITERMAECAVGLIDWFTDMRLSLDINTNSNVSAPVKTANEIINWFKRKNLTETTQRHLQQYGPSCYKNISVSQRKDVLDELVSRGLIDIVVDQKTKKTIIKLVTE